MILCGSSNEMNEISSTSGTRQPPIYQQQQHISKGLAHISHVWLSRSQVHQAGSAGQASAGFLDSSPFLTGTPHCTRKAALWPYLQTPDCHHLKHQGQGNALVTCSICNLIIKYCKRHERAAALASCPRASSSRHSFLGFTNMSEAAAYTSCRSPRRQLAEQPAQITKEAASIEKVIMRTNVYTTCKSKCKQAAAAAQHAHTVMQSAPQGLPTRMVVSAASIVPHVTRRGCAAACYHHYESISGILLPAARHLPCQHPCTRNTIASVV